MNFGVFSPVFVVELQNYVILLYGKKEHTLIWKDAGARGWERERESEREEGKNNGEMTEETWTVKTHMNIGLKMFCKDLVRLLLFIIPLCCWTICCLFVTVVSINKPIYDIILRFFSVLSFSIDSHIMPLKWEGKKKNDEAKLNKKLNYSGTFFLPFFSFCSCFADAFHSLNFKNCQI